MLPAFSIVAALVGCEGGCAEPLVAGERRAVSRGEAAGGVAGRGAVEGARGRAAAREHGADDGHDHGAAAERGADDGHDHGAAAEHGADDGHDHGAAAEHGAGWCSEHHVPETSCTKCEPGRIAAFKDKGDWCEEHGFPESVCPVCNPQEPPIGGDMGGLRLAATAVEKAGIRAIDGRPGPLAARLDLPAEVQFNPDRVAHIGVIAPGQLVSVRVAKGDRVKKGQIVATLRSTAIGRARAAHAKAVAQLGSANKALSRQRRLRVSGITAGRDLIAAELQVARAKADLQAARAELSVLGVKAGAGAVLPVRAPFDGQVIERHASRGEFVRPQDDLFKIADLRQVWVIGRAYDRHMERLAVGARAIVRLDAYAGRSWKGTVAFVAPALDEQTRTVDVRVVLDNPKGILRPGLFGTMVLQAAAPSDKGWILPTSAVQPYGDLQVVFLPGDGVGEFKVRSVKVLRRGGREVEVAGVKAGERVIGPGAFVLKSELVKGSLADSCGGH